MNRTAAYFSALKFHFARNVIEYRMNPRAAYRAGRPYDSWLRSLQLRWKRNPESRDEIRIAVKVLFGDKKAAVIRWLAGK